MLTASIKHLLKIVWIVFLIVTLLFPKSKLELAMLAKELLQFLIRPICHYQIKM